MTSPVRLLFLLIGGALLVTFGGVLLVTATLTYREERRCSPTTSSSVSTANNKRCTRLSSALIPGLRGPVVARDQRPQRANYEKLASAGSSCWTEHPNMYRPQGKVAAASAGCGIDSYPLVLYDGLVLQNVTNAPKEYHTQGYAPDVGQEWDGWNALFFGPATTDDGKWRYAEHLYSRNFSCHFDAGTVRAHVALRCRDHHTGCNRLFSVRCGLPSQARDAFIKSGQIQVSVCDDTCGTCIEPMTLQGQSRVRGAMGVVVTHRIFSDHGQRVEQIARLITWMHHYFAQGATHIIWIDNGQFAEETALEFLEPYIRKGIVSWHWWPYPPFQRMQIPAYNMALYRYRGFQWLVQCDADEFMVLGPENEHRTLKSFFLSGAIPPRVAVVGVSHIYLKPWNAAEERRRQFPLNWTGISNGPMKYSDRGKQVYRPAATWFVGIHEPQLPSWNDPKRTWHAPWDLVRMYHAKWAAGTLQNRSTYLADAGWPDIVCSSIMADADAPLEARDLTLCS